MVNYNKKVFFKNTTSSILTTLLFIGVFSWLGWPSLVFVLQLLLLARLVDLFCIPCIRHFCSEEKAFLLEFGLLTSLCALCLPPLFLLNFTFLFTLDLFITAFFAFALAGALFSPYIRNRAVTKYKESLLALETVPPHIRQTPFQQTFVPQQTVGTNDSSLDSQKASTSTPIVANPLAANDNDLSESTTRKIGAPK